MRLSDTEIRFICEASKKLVSSARVYLYGSRVDLKKKGGDIDLLYVLPDHVDIDTFTTKLRLINELHRLIGEQKIDIIITHQSNLSVDPFLQLVFPSAIELQYPIAK